MKNIIRKIIFCVVVLCSINAYAQNIASIDNRVVVDQMNYCTNSLTNIIHNKSMAVLEHESDQIINNLTMEQMSGLYDIRDFRVELLDAISRFEITEEERTLLRRIQSLKKDNLKWATLSNALSPTMLLTGGGGVSYQVAFQVLLTVARSAVEYKTMEGEQSIEELQAMWELRKEDLQTINEIRKEALNLTFNLYTKYNLSENDRLTEESSNRFSDYLNINDPAQRIRLLENNKAIYANFPAYYYHLGMAYVDMGNYSKAKQQFSVYKEMYNRAPILRYDEKSGCIALTELTYEKGLSHSQKKSLIDVALKNLPNNSAAILQCAMISLYELGDEEKCLKLLLSGIDDPNSSDRSLLLMAVSNLMPIANKYPTIKANLIDAFLHNSDIEFDTYITFLLNTNENAWSQIIQILNFDKLTYRKWSTLWTCKGFNDKFKLILRNGLAYSPEDIHLYIEEHSKNKVRIQERLVVNQNEVDIKDVNKVNCFKANKGLKYLFMETLVTEKTFILKRNIDLGKIRTGDWGRMSEFILSESDTKDIIKFCEKYQPKTCETILISQQHENDKYRMAGSCGLAQVMFSEHSLIYTPSHSPKQKGYYIRLALNNDINLLYQFDNKNKKMIPLYYEWNGNIVFASDEAKNAYYYSEESIVTEKKDMWLSRIWSALFGAKESKDALYKEDNHKDTAKPIKDNKENNQDNWFKKTWKSVAEIFQKDSSIVKTE